MIEDLKISPVIVRRLQAIVAAGAIVFAVGAFVEPARTWSMLLLVSWYALGVALGAAAFVALHYVTGASWSVSIRRVPEALASLIALGGLGVFAVILFHPSLYPWSNPLVSAAMPWFRRAWLGRIFLLVRAAVFLVGWVAFVAAMLRRSRAQDADGDPAKRQSNVAVSTVFLLFFALSVWLASFDWVMSLEPDWASTIFGMYNFAGLFLSAIAVTTIVTVWLRGRGLMEHAVGRDHLHDLGKLLFAFSTFWMYLWFSQYMLIWYANISDETVYYVKRVEGFWGPLFVLNLVLNWVVPFFTLLPRAAKQNPGVLVKISLVLLAGRWLDLYLMIAPPVVGSTPRVGVWEIGLTAGAAAAFTLLLFAALKRAPLVPQKDALLTRPALAN